LSGIRKLIHFSGLTRVKYVVHNYGNELRKRSTRTAYIPEPTRNGKISTKPASTSPASIPMKKKMIPRTKQRKDKV